MDSKISEVKGGKDTNYVSILGDSKRNIDMLFREGAIDELMYRKKIRESEVQEHRERENNEKSACARRRTQ